MNVEEYKKELRILSMAIKSLQAKYTRLNDELRLVCSHANVDHKEKYYHGGYDYSASTFHIYMCLDCGFTTTNKEYHNSGFE